MMSYLKQFAIAAFIGNLLLVLAGRSVADDRPNILLIVGDDMGYADVGVQGCKDIPTPHLDALAAAGVRCTTGYDSAPYCSPSRAGMLTGRYQTRFGHEMNPGQDKPNKKDAKKFGAGSREADEALESTGEDGLPVTETLMAKRFKDAGYATALVGKWHLGSAPQFRPQARGFDEFFGFLGGAHGYFPDAKPLMLRGDESVHETEYLTDAFGREAVSFIDRNTDKPFFLYLAFNAVHTPMNATDDRLKKFKDIKDEKRRTYAAMMSAMDDNIGKVLDKVHEKGLDNKTLVFFISDNGGPTMKGTTINASDNSPLRGSKRTTLEGGIRVPYFCRWPGHVPAGKVYGEPVIQLDILPTSLVAAGIEAPASAKLDGIDLVPYFNGKESKGPHDTLYWRFGPQMAIRRGDWKLVRYDPVVDGEQGRVTDAKLYNLKSDIGESKDLFKSEPEKAKELQAAWDKWNELNVPPLWGNNVVLKKKAAKAKSASAAE
ncbi:MAG TPA: sulfatase [Lacipirellulaceae bacterium]|jgi:arylsulfatase A-like enzyme|nr:sulfatase [Lacipirellulaceae bacterium]